LSFTKENGSPALAVQVSSAGEPRNTDGRAHRDGQRRPLLAQLRLGDLTTRQPVGRGVVLNVVQSAHVEELLEQGVHRRG
jgi:hypothetical protein